MKFLSKYKGFGKVYKCYPQDLAAISSLSEDSAILAPWDVCSLGDERVVNGVTDELAAVKEVMTTCIHRINHTSPAILKTFISL